MAARAQGGLRWDAVSGNELIAENGASLVRPRPEIPHHLLLSTRLKSPKPLMPSTTATAYLCRLGCHFTRTPWYPAQQLRPNNQPIANANTRPVKTSQILTRPFYFRRDSCLSKSPKYVQPSISETRTRGVQLLMFLSMKLCTSNMFWDYCIPYFSLMWTSDFQDRNEESCDPHLKLGDIGVHWSLLIVRKGSLKSCYTIQSYFPF